MRFTVTVDEACKILNRKERTLRYWRYHGIGPLWTQTREPDFAGRLRLPGVVLYNRESVLEYRQKTDRDVAAEIVLEKPAEKPADDPPPPTPEQAKAALAKLLANRRIKTMPKTYGFSGHRPAEKPKSWDERSKELRRNIRNG